MKKLFILLGIVVACGVYGYSQTVVGDVNGDGSVTSADVTVLYNYLLNNETSGMQNGDVDGDGFITAGDVTSVYNILLNGYEPESQVKEYTVNGVSFKMVKVEGGTFMMGNPDYQSSSETANEGPIHQVTLSTFSIGQTEVTQELWQAVMGSNPSNYSGTNLPVEQVSWNQCQAFVAKLNEMLPIEGYEFRLPTEAQWEFAARGGNKSQGYLYSGSNNIGDVAWYQNNSNNKTHQVATKAPNELDIYDMTGNVEEWCLDHYASYSSSPQIDPCVSTGTAYFLVNLRGGFYGANASLCRNTRRDCWDPSQSYMEIGLRLALVPKTEMEFDVNGVNFKMIRVDGGTFMMGASDSDNDAFNGERPAHQVTLSSYYIGQTEVTQELWQAVMGENPSYFVGKEIFVDWGMYITYTDDIQRPVEQVTWDECQEFVAALSQMTGKNFRLPTEAEWEFAARGGNKSQGYKYAGSNDIDAVAWYGGVEEDWYHCIPATTPETVATKQPNELGLYDMSGNVEEWCQDWYGAYSAEAQTNPTGPASGNYNVFRGGAVNDGPAKCRVSIRSYYAGWDGFSRYVGLRLVMSAE